jgi:hypothetical protein
MLRLRVRYRDAVSLVADYDDQVRKGGLLVRVDAPTGTGLFDPVSLEIITPEDALAVEAQVVQQIPGVGVALAFEAADPLLVAAVDAARDAADAAVGPPVHEIVEGDAVSEAAPSGEQVANAAPAGPAAKIHLAKHGNKEERMRIMREGDRSLHRYVLRNPGLRLDEVTFIAKMTSVSVDLLKAIAERRDWAQRPEVALALVRNPKTPVPLAIQMLQHVAPSELRRLAKGSSLRMPILKAARKKVVG